MSDNFFKNGFNSTLNKPFGFNIIPERTMQQVKESAVNLIKDVVTPASKYDESLDKIIDGTINRQINVYQNIINSVNNNMASADKNAYKSLDVKF